MSMKEVLRKAETGREIRGGRRIEDENGTGNVMREGREIGNEIGIGTVIVITGIIGIEVKGGSTAAGNLMIMIITVTEIMKGTLTVFYAGSHNFIFVIL